MIARRPPTPLLVLGVVAVVGVFAVAALLPPFALAVLLMVLVLAAFAILALREGRTG
jgi:hypothetical protein